MKGIKMYSVPDNTGEFIEKIKEVGADTLFLGEQASQDELFIQELKSAGLKLFTVFPVYYNPGFLKENPDYYAVDEMGKRARAEWVHFVCPRRRDYLDLKISELKSYIKKYRPHGISLDFIRFFVFWEKVFSQDQLKRTCYCSYCQSLEDAEEPHRVITEAVKALSEAARESDSRIIVDIHSVPWESGDYSNAQKKIAGQDLKALAPFVDFISPMCYSHMLKKTPSWIHSVTEDHYLQGGIPVIPAVQAGKCYLDCELSPDNYRNILKAALTPPSDGVILFSWDYIAESREKFLITKDIFTSRR